MARINISKVKIENWYFRTVIREFEPTQITAAAADY